MAGRLADKVAIVTGATSDIGRAVTVLFVKEGAKVVFAGIRGKTGQALEQELRSAGGDVLFAKTDVTKTEDLQYLVSKTVERHGSVDVLVNISTAAQPPAPPEETDAEPKDGGSSGDAVKSYLVLCREVLPHMIRRQKGAIINAVSIDGAPEAGSLTAGSGAVSAFTRSLACEYADQNIRVNAVLHGRTVAEATAADSESVRLGVRSAPMGRAALPEEIAWGYVFLASDESSFCTGTTLVIDGGVTAL
jgi:NAD(P)-dependent dehydrogenase (short-subunit alcohol dehydrogenase family)